MKDRLSVMLDNELAKCLESLKYMQPGTNEYQAALQDFETLRAIKEGRKDRIFDKVIKIGSLVVEGGKLVALVGSVVVCVAADQKGWFVSKLGMSMISKPRL